MNKEDERPSMPLVAFAPPMTPWVLITFVLGMVLTVALSVLGGPGWGLVLSYWCFWLMGLLRYRRARKARAMREWERFARVRASSAASIVGSYGVPSATMYPPDHKWAGARVMDFDAAPCVTCGQVVLHDPDCRRDDPLVAAFADRDRVWQRVIRAERERRDVIRQRLVAVDERLVLLRRGDPDLAGVVAERAQLCAVIGTDVLRWARVPRTEVIELPRVTRAVCDCRFGHIDYHGIVSHEGARVVRECSICEPSTRWVETGVSS